LVCTITFKMLTNLNRKYIVWGILVFFVSTARGQNCPQDFALAGEGGGVNWTQFPEFKLPFTVIYSGIPGIFNAEAAFSRGFTHAAHPNGIQSLPGSKRAYIYYGVASSEQPWGKHKSPFGNDMEAYKRKWDEELAYFQSLNGGSNAVDVFCLDIEMYHKSRDSILALRPMAFVPNEIKSLGDDAFVQKYQEEMQQRYAEAARYIRSKVNARIFTSYGDVPIFNTFTNLTGPNWDRWQNDPSLLNFVSYDAVNKRPGGPFYEQMDVLSPNAYFYYDYPHVFAGEYLSYLMFQVEANRAWSSKDQWVFLWNRYSYSAQFAGRNIRPWMSEAMAIFPFFAGAKGAWLWDHDPNPGPHSPYEYYLKGLYRLSAFSSYFEGNSKRVETLSARDYLDSKGPVWRGMLKDGKMLIAAHNPWASHENESSTVKVRYGSFQADITLKGYEIYLCEYAVDEVSAAEPEILELEVYPNPSSGKIRYQISAPQDDNLVLRLIDGSGRVMYTESLRKGSEGVFSGEISVKIDAVVHVQGKYGSSSRRIIVRP
jgi:hypothetical protein